MALFFQMLAVAAGLALTSTVVGGAVLWLCGVRWLWRGTAENLIFRSFLGTAILVLLFGWCSYLGLAAPRATAVTIAGAGALVTAAALRGARPQFARPVRTGNVYAVVLASWAGAVIYLAPLAVGNCFSFGNDTATYVCVSEWLQGHGIGTPIPQDPHQPLAGNVASLQLMGHRMGPMFLLALVQAILPRFLGLELFSAVMAWGLVLNAGGVYLLCRWAFRCRRGSALLAIWVAATTANPLAWSAFAGFFCQVFGTAFLLGGLAFLCRLLAPVRWRIGSAVVVGLVTAGLFSVYSEMVSVFAAACAGTVLVVALQRRGRRLRRLALFVLCITAAAALLTNIELLRAYRALPFMRYRNFGGPDWSEAQRLTFALGARSYFGADTGLVRAAGLGLAVLLMAGVLRAAASRRCLPVACGLAIFALMYLHYHPSRMGDSANDGAALARVYETTPGLEGHAAAIKSCMTAVGSQPRTWFAFKLSKWAFPLVLALQGVGLDWLVRRQRWRYVALAAAFIAAPALAVPLRLAEVTNVVATMQLMLHSDHPLRSIRELRHSLADHPDESYALLPSAEPWPEILLPYLLYPRPVSRDPTDWWSDPKGVPHAAASTLRPGWAFLLIRPPYFGKPTAKLPCDLVLADPTKPSIVAERGPRGFASLPDGDTLVWVGPEAVTLTVWSPAAGPAALSFRAVPGPGPTTGICPVLVRVPGGEPQQLNARPGEPALAVLGLRPGLNTVEVTCQGPGALPAEVVGIFGVRVEPGAPRPELAAAAAMPRGRG